MAVSNFPFAFIPYLKYRYQTNISPLDYNYMVSRGIGIGADPKEWYATFKNIPQEKWVSIELWNGNKWEAIDSALFDAAFEGEAKVESNDFWRQVREGSQN